MVLCHLKQLDNILKQQAFCRARILNTLLASLILTGCSNSPLTGSDSLLRDKSLDYAQAEVTQRLVVPEGLDGGKVNNDLLVIPDESLFDQATGIKDAPRPNFVFAQTGSEVAHFTGAQDQKRISVEGNQERVKEQITTFWANQGIEVTQQPSASVVETIWFSLTEDEPSDDFLSRWVRGLTDADEKVPLGKVKVELNQVSDQRVELSLAFMQLTQLEIDQNVTLNWQEEGRSLPNESEITFELLRFLSQTSYVAQKTDENSQQTVTPLLGKDQFGRPLVKLNMSYTEAFEKVLNAMSVFDMGSFDEQQKKIYFTHTTNKRSLEENVSVSDGVLGWFKGLHSGSDRSEGFTIDSSILGGQEEVQAQAEPVYSSDPSLVFETALEDKKGFKVWMGGKVVYVFEDEDQGDVNDNGEYSYTGRYQLDFKTTLKSVYLQVLNSAGEPAANAHAEEILWKLQRQLDVQ